MKMGSSCLNGLFINKTAGQDPGQRMGRKADGNLWKGEKVITCSFDKVEYSFEIWGHEFSETSHHCIFPNSEIQCLNEGKFRFT